MGSIEVKYLRVTPSGFYWEPSRLVRKLGFASEALGRDEVKALARAKQLNDQVARMLADGEALLPRPPQEGTISWVIAEVWRKSARWKRLAPKTVRGYEQAIAAIEDWCGDKPAASITRKAVKVWQRQLEERAPAMAAAILRVLRIVMNHAIDEGLRTDNPAEALGLHTAGGNSQPWTDGEVQVFCATAQRLGHPSMEVAVMLAVCLGQREADVLRLSWTQLDRPTGGFWLTQAKTKARLFVPALPELLAILGRTEMRSPTIVISEATGVPYKEDHFRHLFRDIADAAGLSKERKFMHLRHTAATRLGEAGASNKQIQAITGHRSEAVLGRYVRPNSEMARSAIGLLQRNRKRTATESGDGK